VTAQPDTALPITIKGSESKGQEEPCSELIRVGIDKIQIRIDFSGCKAPEYNQVQEWARSVFANEFGKKHSVWTYSQSSLTNVSQELEGGGTLFMRYGRHRGEFRAWFEFNPNKVMIVELAGRVNTMLEKGIYSLLERGTVTYCEFAMDVPNAQIEDYIFLSRTHHRYDFTWTDRGSIDIGSRKFGDLYFHIYDKRRQLKEVEKKALDRPRLRIEARISGKRKFPLFALLELQNPFSTLLVLRKDGVAKISEGAPIGSVAFAGAPHEAQLELSKLVSKEKKSAIELLSKFEVGWWKPDVPWKRLEESLDWLTEGVACSGCG